MLTGWRLGIELHRGTTMSSQEAHMTAMLRIGTSASSTDLRRGSQSGSSTRRPSWSGSIVDSAAKNRFPSMYTEQEFVFAGGLMTYGVNLLQNLRRAATHVDKILKGARPADLPVERPTKFELLINLRTARALGLTIPPTVLMRADQLIQ